MRQLVAVRVNTALVVNYKSFVIDAFKKVRVS